MLELAAAIQRVIKSSTDEELKEKIRPLVSSLPRDIIPDSTSAQYAWGLLLDEFNLVSIFTRLSSCTEKENPEADQMATSEILQMPSSAHSGPSKEPQKDRSILCVAAATIELSAIHAYLASKFGAPHPIALDGGEDYALQFHDSESQTIWNVVTLSFQGASEAALEVRHLSHLIKPHIILMVGMCMGMPKRKYPVGTVVVPNEVFAFDHERLTASGTQNRPHGDRVDNGIYRLARILGVSQPLNYQVITDKGLASASRKVEDSDTNLIKFIDTTFPDVAAYDMEGWGFYRAGSGQQCLWIKSVADSGEAPEPDAGGQTKKLNTQAKATDSAIDFAILVVRNYFKLRNRAGI
jgi:nucleoside phosphorylase